MERDIRDLFKEDEEVNVELPKNHRTDFIQKLLNQEKKVTKNRTLYWLKIAAILVLFFSVLTYIFVDESSNPLIKKTAIQVEVKAIEKEYLEQIENEWKEFLSLSKDSILITKYKAKLKTFDADYSRITNQLKEAPNNIYILESLINNLQRRLELIKNIKEHIKELNQKNVTNETIYL